MTDPVTAFAALRSATRDWALAPASLAETLQPDGNPQQGATSVFARTDGDALLVSGHALPLRPATHTSHDAVALAARRAPALAAFGALAEALRAHAPVLADFDLSLAERVDAESASWHLYAKPLEGKSKRVARWPDGDALPLDALAPLAALQPGPHEVSVFGPAATKPCTFRVASPRDAVTLWRLLYGPANPSAQPARVHLRIPPSGW